MPINSRKGGCWIWRQKYDDRLSPLRAPRSLSGYPLVSSKRGCRHPQLIVKPTGAITGWQRPFEDAVASGWPSPLIHPQGRSPLHNEIAVGRKVSARMAAGHRGANHGSGTSRAIATRSDRCTGALKQSVEWVFNPNRRKRGHALGKAEAEARRIARRSGVATERADVAGALRPPLP
jgi:hypothetical protein